MPVAVYEQWKKTLVSCMTHLLLLIPLPCRVFCARLHGTWTRILICSGNDVNFDDWDTPTRHSSVASRLCDELGLLQVHNVMFWRMNIRPHREGAGRRSRRVEQDRQGKAWF
ncbi:hypothetical protein B0H34DRAFT_176450 [Crassisporium funariophilum]|nr:hypothetical protein B0H34DRAFT_176450 [Crassisporium funariophilum]